ncbi:hypothetical protein [Oricola cellulosilytica]|uniref:Uncharacterized protein n=1 Tax=Oricola cellulosilytica TaxID=1429082 RepID=A0A4R0PF66_9HYPH|nr:hypothetical protein [Oricola cellulosilytica]TCD16475.1 hypothetical protein E0D97_03355 [Oricola cellulosilytica]
MKKPAEQITEDDVVIEHQERLRREVLEHHGATLRDIDQDTRSIGRMQSAKPGKKSRTERSLCEVAEKARRAPRDG